jgi:protein NRD1
MSSPVADLEAGLNAMLNLKPPGVSGSQIKNITALCVDNVQVSSTTRQMILTGSALARDAPVTDVLTWPPNRI